MQLGLIEIIKEAFQYTVGSQIYVFSKESRIEE